MPSPNELMAYLLYREKSFCVYEDAEKGTKIGGTLSSCSVIFLLQLGHVIPMSGATNFKMVCDVDILSAAITIPSGILSETIKLIFECPFLLYFVYDHIDVL